MRIAVLLLSLSITAQSFRKTYTDEKHGYAVPIPNGWTVSKPSDSEPRLIMKAPVRDRSGATLILKVSDPQPAVTSGTLTLDAYLEEVKKQYPSRFEDLTWVKTEKGKHGENLSLALYYTYSSSGQKVGQMQYLVWTKDHHYSLSWGCLDSKFKRNQKLFEKASKALKPGAKK